MRYPSSVAAFAIISAIGVSAQDQGRPGGPGSPGLAIFQALDVDHDNALSPAEIDGAPAVLRAMDKNGDGKLTPDEFPMLGRGGPGGRGGRGGAGGGEGRGGGSGVGEEAPAAPTSPDELANMLMAFDKNKDGKLTKAEVPDRLQGLFARIDENHDGVLTADEIKKAAAAQSQPAAMPEGGRGEGGRDGRAGGPPRPDLLFQALDQNHDGELSADEIAAAPASLRKLDTNGDGILSMTEALGGGRGRG